MTERFGTTWWGRSWVDALEHRAQLDPNRLPRGRTYARGDRANRIEVQAGRITALVRGGRALPYRVTVTIPTFDDAQWAAVVAAISGRAAHVAALLDGELDRSLAEAASAAGIDLFPGPGELRTTCSCPDRAEPCKHAAAVCYLVARELDADPFVLFALRGRARGELLAAVRAARRSPAPASGRAIADAFGGGAVVDPGEVARDAWARPPQPAPDRRPLPDRPGTPSGWPTDPPRGAPFTQAGLDELATDAAQRAWHQLAEGAPSHLDLDEGADVARRAAGRLGRLETLLELSRRTGISSAQLTHQALAWRSAGVAGLHAVQEELWRPPTEVVELGLAAFTDVGIDPADVQIRSNRLTCGDVQLRVSSDGRWWRYERRGRSWELVEPPTEDPTELVSG